MSLGNSGRRDDSQIVDAGLQNERTALSWTRSIASLLGGATLLARVASVRHSLTAAVVAGVALALAVVCTLATSARYHRARVALDAGRALPDAVLPTIAAVCVVATGVGAVILIIGG